MEQKDFVKLTDTVYSLLEYFPESEPLKNKAKEQALLIMDNLTLLFGSENWVQIKNCLPGVKAKAAIQILENANSLLNYLELARRQRWISGFNYLIIQNEYEKIKKKIAPTIKTGAETALESAITRTNSKRQDIHLPKVTARQKKIIEFLEKTGSAQVSDLISVLPNITKRTIRRDVDDLLKTGRISRFGEFNHVFYRLGQDRTDIS